MIEKTIFWIKCDRTKNQLFSLFKLDNQIEEDLRFTIDLFLPNTVNGKIIQSLTEWVKMVEKCQELFNYFPYYFIKSKKKGTGKIDYIFFDGNSISPYHIMINELILLPFLKSVEFEDDFFKLKEHLELDYLNNNYEYGKVVPIERDHYLKIIDDINLAIKASQEEMKLKSMVEKIINHK